MAHDYQFRPATVAEIIEHYARDIASGRKVQFRHFTVELYNARNVNGVAHRQHSRAALRVIDGIPHVRHHGKLEPVTATATTGSNGRLICFDLRLDSPYLRA